VNQIAIITGGAGGMGAAIARRLAKTRTLLLTDVDPDRLGSLTAELRSEGYQAHAVCGDIADPQVSAELARQCAAFGTLATLVNAAGLSPVQSDWRTIIAANIVAPQYLLRAVEPLLGNHAVGIMIASVAGHLGPTDTMVQALLDDSLQPNLCELLEPLLAELAATHGGTMEGHAYSLSKRAIIRMCERLALDWGRHGARIVSLSPGVVWTPMGRQEAASGNRAQAMADATPIGRWGTAEDIAATAEFLASDAASYITGCDIRVDGGAVAAMRGQNF
jgi:NAD(P)-dependent dehydrogenase (short-subunit alcohol dehydrogenase family)